MGTRSLTIIYNEYGNKPLCALYRQFDGYLSGHGAELKGKFGKFQIINGISMGDNTGKANGMGCLAAQIIAHFKTEIGHFYIEGVEDYQEYNYHLYYKDGRIWVKVTGYDNEEMIFEGWLTDLPEDEEE